MNIDLSKFCEMENIRQENCKLEEILKLLYSKTRELEKKLKNNDIKIQYLERQDRKYKRMYNEIHGRYF